MQVQKRGVSGSTDTERVGALSGKRVMGERGGVVMIEVVEGELDREGREEE